MSRPSESAPVRAGMQEVARHVFNHALKETTISRAFRRHVSAERGVLRISDDLYDLNAFTRVFVISLGKAAHSMLAALVEQAGERFTGIVASSLVPEFQLRGFRYYHGGHPFPNHESIRAADAMLKSVGALNESSLVIYLVSGGGSAAAEKPIDEEISLADLDATYRALVHSGAPIGEINAIRKHLSAIKGGRLAQAAYPAQQVSVLVSDVPDSTPDALASGPTMPDGTTVETCYEIVAKSRLSQGSKADRSSLAERFPPPVRELFERHALEETPKSDDPAFVRARWWTVLSNAALLETAKQEAERLGWAVHIDNGCDDFDYREAARYLMGQLRALRETKARVCLLSGGEVTVPVEDGGTGGRNQQFALYCAQDITGQDICVLSAGSDGIDGNSPAAGAIADGSTLERANARGLDAASHLARFDAYPLFEALGDAIVTGPTGNNLRDIRVLLAA
jgi:glycerate 2-kinase